MNYNDGDNETEILPLEQGKTFEDINIQESERVFEEYVKATHLTHTKRVIEIRQEEHDIS